MPPEAAATLVLAMAAKALLPKVAVYGVEPAGFDDTARSISAGQRVVNGADAATICDALTVSTPAAMTFAINRKLVDGMLTVSDPDVLAAMKRAFLDLKLVVEPGGAAALAALLAGKLDVRGNKGTRPPASERVGASSPAVDLAPPGASPRARRRGREAPRRRPSARAARTSASF